MSETDADHELAYGNCVDDTDVGAGDITYQDVFDRVRMYLENNGYYLSAGQNGESVSMVMDDDGMVYMRWDNVEDFLTAPLDEHHHAEFDQSGCANIFEIAEFWEGSYDRLIRWPAAFIDSCGDLARIDYTDKTPAGLMRALDAANFGKHGDDGSGDDDNGNDVSATDSTNVTESEAQVEPVRSGQRFCDQCGARLEVGCAFCIECGASIDSVAIRSDGERTFYLPEWIRNEKDRGRLK